MKRTFLFIQTFLFLYSGTVFGKKEVDKEFCDSGS